ncbi:MAG: phosphodiester glycosidase family protein [Myxococcota bacterium]
MVLHVLEVDLRTEGLEVDATAHEQRWSSVRELARAAGQTYAINGGFWESMAQPGGLQVGGGEAWPNALDDERYGLLGIRRRRGELRAFVEAPEVVRADADGLDAAVSGRPLLVRDGEVATAAIDATESANRLQPRTAAGVSRSGRRLWLAVTDGRQPHSRGITLYELARTLRELGADDAINLDGGGSSTLFIDRLGGVVNAPSGSRWEHALGLGPERLQGEVVRRERGPRGARVYVRGVEREVMNHLGIRTPSGAGLPPPVLPPLAVAAPNAEPVPTVVLPPRPPRLRTGRLAEQLLLATPIFGALVSIVALLRRRRRRKSAKAVFVHEGPPDPSSRKTT